jgi:exodeoxyribonuclease VII small subunit
LSSSDPTGRISPPLPAEPGAAGFDEVLAQLEKTIRQLADGTAPLDELVAAHQRAASLLAQAEERLTALKTQAERLARSLAE